MKYLSSTDKSRWVQGKQSVTGLQRSSPDTWNAVGCKCLINHQYCQAGEWHSWLQNIVTCRCLYQDLASRFSSYLHGQFAGRHSCQDFILGLQCELTWVPGVCPYTGKQVCGRSCCTYSASTRCTKIHIVSFCNNKGTLTVHYFFISY